MEGRHSSHLMDEDEGEDEVGLVWSSGFSSL